MNRYRNPWLLILLVITGFVLGGLIGTSLGTTLPFLSYGPDPLGIQNFEVNLGLIYLNLTFLIRVNVASLIGLFLAVIIFKKM
ncbi:conserved hypothetical protein [Alkaliphilus metalliredigens QYMF]|uniref:DUF4321 domain-containing protein n=1 Tax=Alkaliphilus metalliredigens (strain QYMF) TaxID=293826 RepID=A6TQH6_ALKMQ|nr:DUF4321 domain-containing protein [Alkaliphilus metalliredigens]ABR48444.1 conserved hypothetical protein [Alkaliphilus metalliredigens QYMF]